jgi:ribosomal protein S19
MIVVPEMIGSVVGIYNGKVSFPYVTPTVLAQVADLAPRLL